MAGAAFVEETAAALEQITITVRDSTIRVEDAGKLVSKVREGVEQSTATSHGLAREAAALNALLSQFDLDGSDADINRAAYDARGQRGRQTGLAA